LVIDQRIIIQYFDTSTPQFAAFFVAETWVFRAKALKKIKIKH